MVRVEIYHNISDSGFFGLNTVFENGGKSEALEDEKRHPLVLVFKYELTGPPGDDAILAEAFEVFNIGDDPSLNGHLTDEQRDRATAYRRNRLRSLSTGDVVVIQGQPYSCESAGWRARSPDELRILQAEEAEPVIRERYDIPSREALSISVPWSGAARS